MILKTNLGLLVAASLLQICWSIPKPAPTSISIQKSISVDNDDPQSTGRSNSEGWEPMVVQLLPKDSYLPQPKNGKTKSTTTEKPETATTEQPSKDNDVDSDQEQEAQGSSYASQWTPLGAHSQYGLPLASYGQPAYYPSPAMFGLPVNNYLPPAFSYGAPSGPAAYPPSAYGAPLKEPVYTTLKAAEGPEHFPSQYASPLKEGGAVGYSSAQYGVPIKSAYGAPGKSILPGYEAPSKAVVAAPEYDEEGPEPSYGAPVKEAVESQYGEPAASVGYGHSQAYGPPEPVYGPPAVPVHYEPVVKKQHVKHETLIHRHNHHKHLVHEHHLHKLHVHNHHLHRFHVHNHNLHKEHIHVPIQHVKESHVTKETEEHQTKKTVGETHKHVQQVHETFKHAEPMYVVKPQHPGWSVWG